jgi:hypothetical protein
LKHKTTSPCVTEILLQMGPRTDQNVLVGVYIHSILAFPYIIENFDIFE